MNLELLYPLAQEYPDKITQSLDSSASVAQFSPKGDMLAAGRDDGVVEVWDLHTQNVTRHLEGHVKGVVSVSWSRNGRFLLTASRDWTCAIWDTKRSAIAGCRRDTIRFDAQLSGAVFHPQNSHVVLATLATNECILVDLRKPRRAGRWMLHDPEEPYSKSTGITCARFTPDGKFVWAGTGAGHIMIFDAPTKQLIVSAQLDSRASIRRLEVDPLGRYFAAISSDRFVRIYKVSLPDFSQPPPQSPNDENFDVPPDDGSGDQNGAPHDADQRMDGDEEEEEIGVILVHAYSDQVGRCSWTGLAWSPDGECVIGGSGDKGSHKLFIWYRSGGLAKILEDRGQAAEDVAWHPQLPMIASVASSGRINIWSAARVENWSAFAPGFEELEENIEYEEREDEFDIEDESELLRRKRAVEDVEVDIGGTPPPTTKPPKPETAMDEWASDSDDDPDFFPPVHVDDTEGDML